VCGVGVGGEQGLQGFRVSRVKGFEEGQGVQVGALELECSKAQGFKLC
jgi:hypothetical protein